MRLNTKILTILSTALIAASCTNTTYLDFPGTEPLIVMNAQISTSDSVHVVKLSKSTLSVADGLRGAVVTASVERDGTSTPVTVTEQPVSDEYGSERNPVDYSFKFKFRPGDRLTLKASAASLPDASATVTAPDAVEIVSVDTVSVKPGKNEDPNRSKYLVRVKIKDIPGQQNYYRISPTYDEKVVFKVSYWDYNEETMEYERVFTGETEEYEAFDRRVTIDLSSEPLFSGGSSLGGGLLDDLIDSEYGTYSYNTFTDSAFEDSEYTLRIYVFLDLIVTAAADAEEIESAHAEIKMNVWSMSFEQFHYLKAINYDSDMGVFAEAVTIPSNVEGGTGQVSIETRSSVTFMELDR